MAVSGHSREGARRVTGRRALPAQAPVTAGLGGGALCGAGPRAFPAAWRRPRPPRWVQGAILGQGAAAGGAPRELGREPLSTEEPPLPTRGANTYSTGFAVERGGGRAEGMTRKGGKQR